MSDQTLLDLSDLAVERIEVVPADSLDSAPYGHGMPELAASCYPCIPPCSSYVKASAFLPEDWDWADG
jgi:hypothetical protein